jgi:serine/threonine protein kinase
MPSPPDPTETTQWLAAIFCPQCQSSFVPAPLRAPNCPKCGRTFSQIDRLPPSAENDEIQFDPSVNAVHSDRDIRPEQLLGRNLDVYSLRSLLGVGAMGWVYLARHRMLHRSCALKILSPRLVIDDPQFVARFLNEGRAAAALIHPNIVTVHAIGEANGFYFLEMEFVAGRSLRTLLDEEGPLSPERATALTLRIAEGLAAAHKTGILHRDLKPDNVLLTHQQVPKIVDFGLARRMLIQGETTGQDFVGTPAYMAPELYQGQPATPASDIYSLGVNYFQLLTGKVPYPADDFAALKDRVLHAPIPSLRDLNPRIPLEVAECVHHLMAKAPENRPANGVAAAQLLQAVLGQSDDLETLIRQAFQEHPEILWQREGDRYGVQMQFLGGRGQKVFIEPNSQAAAEPLVTIGSVCCRAVPAYFETALRLNSEILHGALAIRQIAGESLFVVLDNYPRSTIDPEEIRRSVLEVAHRADAIEKLLTGGDTN